METKKLTAKDLMVGDYVYRPDCYDKVVEVRKDTILGSDPLRGLIPITDLQPIPLTAEVLEKNGFIKYLWDIYRLPKTDFSIEYTGGLFILRISNERLCEVKSVSHLQHLLRDFNVDKEIVL